mmetsp:Transcript_103525/g.333589  ORF Transcript_103525/g.333589 Transcript_103525/m.333589 type:complete len:298 (-) Transcript_103525:55-948(-)
MINHFTWPSSGLLSYLRPKPRWIFFPVFAAVCAWIIALNDQCDIKGKKKDCGYSGITPNACKTRACFLKGGKGYEKRTVKVTLEQGAALGLSLSRRDGGVVVSSILEGSVSLHNAAAATSEDVILAGDGITRVAIDGKVATNLADIEKAVNRPGAGKAVEIDVLRSRLPSFLQWVHDKGGTPNMVEKLLSSPGTLHFASVWSRVGGVGFAAWYISGYSPASLPLYATLSAAVAWELSRCCHDESVGAGVPHCFRSKRDELPKVVQKVWAQTSEKVAQVRKDPRSYARWLFLPTAITL